MSKILESFKNKSFRYGSFSTVMVIIAIGLFIFVNLVADQLNVTHDLTQDQLFTLSQGSLNIIRDLDSDVQIYSLWVTGQENFMFQQLLNDYANNSPRITVSNRDPLLHPAFVEQFAEPNVSVDTGSIIVVGQNRHRVIPVADLVTTQMNWQTFQNQIVSFNVEPQVTNAINFVTATETPVIYRVIGGNEFELPPALIQEITMAGYELRETNLLTGEVPEDAEMLLITFPEVDWSPTQAERILDFLQNDGRAMVVLGYRATRFDNLNEVFAAFGVEIGDYIVVEGSTAHFQMNNPLMLMPEFVSSEITDDLIARNARPFLEQATGINTLDLRRPSTRIEPLIVTSTQAFGRSDPTIAAVTQVPEDAPGPFNLAVSIEDNFFVPALGQSLTTRMVIISNDFILSEAHNAALGGANWNFFVNSLNWLRGAESTVFIPAQAPPTATTLTLTQGNALFIAFITIILIPLAFAVAGVFVWVRRRNA
ncbi:MAG: GldG family protein [Defluviitaleaceae bacterium]|nr:GldG family protein [Defluviitaleaceae bacterium]